ncbi:MAG: hypothetical protein ACOYXT_16985 [Bacteroidota bacterium]
MRNLIILFAFFSFAAKAQATRFISEQNRIRANYDSAYLELKDMLEGRTKASFKRAVFITENAYLNNKETYEDFNDAIAYLTSRAKIIADQGQLIYEGRDKEHVSKNAAVFKLMTDTVKYHLDSGYYRMTIPYSYDFDDFFGESDWTKMFVIKLLRTNKGNCHSLPMLYKILCEQLGTKAFLAMAPNHIYVKQFAQSTGWYNTELTSGQFPIDAWIMASGYIHLSAIQSGVYMDTLSLKQSLAVCVTDLAKGYERIFPDDLEFQMQCADLTLTHYPIYTNALILKAEILKKRFEKQMKKTGVQYPSEIFSDPEAKALFDKMESLYFHIHQIGYRMMPKEMYINWLMDLKNHREKYQNKELVNKLNSR